MVNIATHIKTMKNITAKKPIFNLTRSNHALAAIGQEFPLQLIETDPRTALITLAFMFSNGNTMRCQQFGVATSQLAIFAAQPFAGIDADHYQLLRKRVTDYCNYCVQLDGENAKASSAVHTSESQDQADGFANDSQPAVATSENVASDNARSENDSDAEISDYQRMIRMLTFILTTAEAVFELEQVKRSVQKQLHTKSRPSSNARRGNVFQIELPETTATTRAEVIALLETAGWAPERLSDSVFEVRGRRNAGFDGVERQKPNGTDSTKTLAGGEPDSDK